MPLALTPLDVQHPFPWILRSRRQPPCPLPHQPPPVPLPPVIASASVAVAARAARMVGSFDVEAARHTPLAPLLRAAALAVRAARGTPVSTGGADGGRVAAA